MVDFTNAFIQSPSYEPDAYGPATGEGEYAASGIEVMEQPPEVKFRFGTKEHDDLLSKLTLRRNLGHTAVSGRFQGWDDVDNTLKMKIDLSQGARLGDGAYSEQKREMPFERSIVVPMSFAMLQVRLAQEYSIMMGRDPVFPIEGVSPEDVVPAKMMETTIAYDCRESNVPLTFYQWIWDYERYNLGIMFESWEDEWGWVLGQPQVPSMMGMGGPMGGYGKRLKEWGKVRSYNQIKNVDPRRFYHDPRVSFGRTQDGEFCGHGVRQGFMFLKERELKSGNGAYFNLDEVKKHAGLGGDRATRWKELRNERADELDRGTYCLDHLQVKLIPREWQLGSSEKPEIWMFSWTDDAVIVRAHASPYAHGKFTYSVAEGIADLHSLDQPGWAENLEGLQRMANWLFNCYDKETEVLTDSGWVPFPLLTDSHKVATVDPKSRRFWFETPSARQEYDYDGEMVSLSGLKQDLLVTPNHKLLVGTRSDKYELIPAEQLIGMPHERFTMASLVYDDSRACEPSPLLIGGRAPIRNRGHARRWVDSFISPDALAEFIGWFVSEGYAAKGSKSGTYSVSIKQKKQENIPVLDKIFGELPFKHTRYVDPKKNAVSWTISHRYFFEFLKSHCYNNDKADSYSKKLPDFVRAWPTRLLKKVLFSALAGDGTQINETLWAYTSRSKQLADDIGEIAFKLGARVRFGQYMHRGKPVYRVSISFAVDRHSLLGKHVGKKQYAGKVYCFTNSTHVTVVRRNGVVSIHGQSHIEHVRRAINNSMIYPPSLIEEIDLLYPTPGGHIRMSQRAEELMINGMMSPGQLVFQLSTNDTTRGHLNDMASVMDMAQRMTGANDPAQGIPMQDRRTLGEVQAVMAAASQRISTTVRLADMQALAPLAKRLMINRQQFTEEAQWYRITGDLAKDMDAFVARGMGGNIQQMPGSGLMQALIGPSDIAGNFDYISHTGNMPPDPSRSATTWMQLLQSLAQGPQLFDPMQYPDGRIPDFRAIFNEFVRSMGIKNVEQFYRVHPQVLQQQMQQQQMQGGQPGMQVVPDEQFQQQSQAGNYVDPGEA